MGYCKVDLVTNSFDFICITQALQPPSFCFCSPCFNSVSYTAPVLRDKDDNDESCLSRQTDDNQRRKSKN